MTNPYYNAPTIPVDFTLAKAPPIRQQFESIAAAFDKIDGRMTFIPAAGTANVLTAALTVALTAYVEGFTLYLKITTTNTGPATLNVNGLGAVQIVTRVNDPLVAGDLLAGSVETLFYVNGKFMIREVAGAQGPAGPAGATSGVVGPTGPQGPAGPAGTAGVAGRTVLNGVVDPVAGNGIDGDFFVNTATWRIFGPKAIGAWPAGVNLIGPTGAQGIQGIQGIQGPAGPAGADGAGSTWGALGGKPPELVSFAALSGIINKIAYFSGIDTLSLADLSVYMRGQLAIASKAAWIADLGVISVSSSSFNSPGWLRLNCGGIVFSIMWGVNTVAGNGSTVITYPNGGFTSFSIPVCSSVTGTGTDATQNPAGVLSATLTDFTVLQAGDVARPAFWIAVGV